MTRDERRALGRSLFATLHTTLPLHHGPAIEAVLRELGEDAGKINLPVAQRSEPPRPFDPGLVASVNSLPAGGMEFRVLHVEHLDAIVEIDELQVIKLLQNKM